MKTRKNKKHYNFTEKQKRNDSHRIFCRDHCGSVKEYQTFKNRTFRRANQRILFQVFNYEEEIPFIRYRKVIRWEY